MGDLPGTAAENDIKFHLRVKLDNNASRKVRQRLNTTLKGISPDLLFDRAIVSKHGNQHQTGEEVTGIQVQHFGKGLAGIFAMPQAKVGQTGMVNSFGMMETLEIAFPINHT